MTRLYDIALAPAGLGLNQYAILARLARFGPMRLMDLAANLVMDRSTLGHLLRPLEARGLVEMRVGESDRRSRIIALTADGGALTAQAFDLWANAERAFGKAFGEADAQSMRAVLKRIETVQLEGIS